MLCLAYISRVIYKGLSKIHSPSSKKTLFPLSCSLVSCVLFFVPLSLFLSFLLYHRLLANGFTYIRDACADKIRIEI